MWLWKMYYMRCICGVKEWCPDGICLLVLNSMWYCCLKLFLALFQSRDSILSSWIFNQKEILPDCSWSFTVFQWPALVAAFHCCLELVRSDICVLHCINAPGNAPRNVILVPNVRVCTLKQVTGSCRLAKPGWSAGMSTHRMATSYTCVFWWALTGI